MPPALTPDLALSYVRELSADVRAVVALGPSGEPLAGDPVVAAAARALLDAAPAAAELEVVTPAGVACAVRGGRHALVAACGPLALPGVVRQDLRAAVGALEPGVRPTAPAEPREPPAGAPPERLERPAGAPPERLERPAGAPPERLERLADALLEAAKRGSGA
jgi:hypothetical protein